MRGWGTERPCLAPGVSEGTTSCHVRMRPPLWCWEARQPPTVWKNVCIAARVHPLPLSSISHGGALSVWLRGGIWIRLSPVSRINHFSFRLIVYPQSTELDQKLQHLFSKKIFQVGKNVPAGGGGMGELGRRLLKVWNMGNDCGELRWDLTAGQQEDDQAGSGRWGGTRRDQESGIHSGICLGSGVV